MFNMMLCKLCGHEWKSRKVHPLACPRCKRYDWDGTADHLVKAQYSESKASGTVKDGVEKDFDFGA